ncbi:hypothetical protein ES703_90344 [subsurface metagenome]
MNIKKFFISFAIITIIIFVIATNISALTEGYCVTAEVSDISPSSIGIGEEFTVGVQIENCGDEMPEYVSFELLNPPIDITIKEPLIINISKLYYGNSERFIIYHMKTTDDAQPGTHLIKTRLSYGKTQYSRIKNYNITIEVIGDKAELSIASLKTKPVLPKKGETVELTLRIENTGDGTAKSVEVYMNHSFQGLKQSFIGALDSDEDGPAVLTFIVDKPGEFEFPVTISYKDDFGDNEIKTKVSLNVLKKKSNIGAIILAILIIAVLGGGIYYFIKTKKSKDKIIHQLLQGENVKPERLEKTTKKHIKKSQEEEKKREKKEKRIREFKREILEKYKK